MNKSLATAILALSMMTGSVAAAVAAPKDNVRVTIERWRQPGSNNIGTADIAITNDNPFAVKDIRVKCDYVVKAGGKTIETMQTLPMIVKPKTTKKFRKVKFAYIDIEAAEGACVIQSVAQN